MFQAQDDLSQTLMAIRRQGFVFGKYLHCWKVVWRGFTEE
jgi:hypothetical protein